MSFIYKIKPVGSPQFGLELSDSFHDVLHNGSLEELLQTKIRHGNQTVPFSDFFEVGKVSLKQATSDNQNTEEDHSDRPILWEGDFSRVHGIGRGWKQGKMQVTGSVGDCLGEGMTGGKIVVTENAADAVGNSMSGGQIIIQGNVGNWAGSSSSGELRGMTGGEILVAGSAANYVGARMRRGTIVVQRNVGDYVGKEMLAGSILLFGNHQGLLGVGMKRGSIILFKKNKTEKPEDVNRTFGLHFDPAVTYQPVFLRALLKHLEQVVPFPIDPALYDAWYRRYSGDMSEGGRGEILVRSEAVA